MAKGGRKRIKALYANIGDNAGRAMSDSGTIKLVYYAGPPPVISGDFTLTWTASESGHDSYKVYWGETQGGPYTESEDVGDVLEFTPSTLVSGHTYYFVVVTVRDGFESDYSDEYEYAKP